MNFNLLNIFKKSSKGYIGLFLRETDGVIIYLDSDKETRLLQKIDSERFTLTHHWDHLADDVDDALYKLEVRTKKSFDDVIFFVYSHMVEPNTHELKRQNLASIKNLVKSMELKPLGFIEAHEAYITFLQSRDKQPLSALIVESDNDHLTVFAYQSSKVISQVSTIRKKGFLPDLVEVLTDLKETVVLPQQIILLPSKNQQDGADLIEHTWDEKLFSHQPTISIVQDDEIVNSLIHTFASQINEVPDNSNSTPEISSNSEIFPNEERELDEELALDQDDRYDTAQPIAPSDKKVREKMGFVIGGETQFDSDVIDRSSVLKPTFMTSVSRYWSLTQKYIKIAITRLKTVTLFRSRTLFLHSSIAVGAILILIALFLIELHLHKASVTLALPSQKLTLSRSFDAAQFGIKEASNSAEFSAQVTATGVKNVGETAKGGVTVYNSSLASSKTFAKGTTLTGPGNITFTLDTEVKLASASGDAIDIVSSSANSNVTATAIGPESNLAAGTKFSVGDEANTVVIAKNDSSFTGGTKRQIQVVSDKDIAKAESQINTKAQEFAKTTAQKKLGDDAVLLKQLTNVEVESQNANYDIGQEASSVTVESKVGVGYSYISVKKLKEAVKNALKPKVQKDLKIIDENIKYTITNVTQKNNKVQISVRATAHAVPPLTEEEIISSIKGKTIGGLQDIARKQYRAQSVDFTIEHPIGLLKSLLPLFPNNIKLRLLYP